MAKNQTVFVCSECGNESPKWLGKCPACNAWNTFYEEKIIKDKSTGNYKKVEGEMIKLNEVQINTYARQKTNYSELDRVLGGGLVQGSLILLGGEPRNW